MKKKRKCYVCGAKLAIRKENVYTVTEPKSIVEAFSAASAAFDVMDCPQCGCQQLLASRLPRFEFIVSEGGKYENGK